MSYTKCGIMALALLVLTAASGSRAFAQQIPSKGTYGFSFGGSNVVQLIDVPGVSISGQFDVTPSTSTFTIANGLFSLNNNGTVCNGTFTGTGTADALPAGAPSGTMVWSLTGCPGYASQLNFYYGMGGTGSLITVAVSVIGLNLAVGLGYAAPTTFHFIDIDSNLVSGLGTASQEGNSLGGINIL